MSTQRTFKRRVRARMSKTGESYTGARSQLIRKAGQPEPEPVASSSPEPELVAASSPQPEPVASSSPEPAAATVSVPAASVPAVETIDPGLLPTTDEAMRTATGRAYAEWFQVLDDWGAGDRTHTEIATWLVAEQGVAGWWAQTVTVGYERVRGRRSIHQMVGGYSVGANRTVAVDADRLLEAFVDEARSSGWLSDAAVTPRRNRQGLGIRFGWSDPPSRVAVFSAERGPGKATLSVQHEKLPDAAAGERLKVFWREQLTRLKSVLEQGASRS